MSSPILPSSSSNVIGGFSLGYLPQQQPQIVYKDKRSNRRRVSCGFHHKRHQACPENCEGRVSHPPEPHAPVQDKFTVGCSECKSFYQSKQHQLVQAPLSPPSSNNCNNNNSQQQPIKKRAIEFEQSPVLQTSPFNTINSSPSNSRPISPICEVPQQQSPNLGTSTINTATSTPPRPSKFNLYIPSKSFEDIDYSPPEPMHKPLPQRRVSGPITSFSRSRLSPELVYSSSSSDEGVGSPSNSMAFIVPSPMGSPSASPRGSDTTASAPASESGLFHLLEQEVEKEIFTQAELELIKRKRLQMEEREKVDRVQQLLDYQKIQQQMEYQRLKKQSDELELWRSNLALVERELLFKEDTLTKKQQQHFSSSPSVSSPSSPVLPRLSDVQPNSASSNIILPKINTLMSFDNLLNTKQE